MIATALYFVMVYGFMAGMIAYAWVKEPKDSDNTGMRL